jgi:hypothetical protein
MMVKLAKGYAKPSTVGEQHLQLLSSEATTRYFDKITPEKGLSSRQRWNRNKNSQE